MNPLFILSAVFATACAAPTWPLAGAPLAAAGYAGAPLAAAGYAAAPLAAAPLATAGYAAAPIVEADPIALPAPYTTQQVQGAPSVSIAQAPAQVTKQIHYADRTYIAGYNTQVHKPAIPDFRIAVPTALKGTVSHNAPIVKAVKETHVVNEPVPVERPYAAPYDVIKHVEQIVEVPTPVHVNKPYAVPHPVPVQGEPIVQKVVGAPIVKHTHSYGLAAPAAVAAAPAAIGHY